MWWVGGMSCGVTSTAPSIATASDCRASSSKADTLQAEAESGWSGEMPVKMYWKAASGMRALYALSGMTTCPGMRGLSAGGRQTTQACRFVSGTRHGHVVPSHWRSGRSGCAFLHSHVVGLRANMGSGSRRDANIQWSAVKDVQPKSCRSCRTAGRRRNRPTGFSTEITVGPPSGWAMFKMERTRVRARMSLMHVGELGRP